MIPKIIHYVWLGEHPIPKEMQVCIDSWKKHMPEYELRCWDDAALKLLDSVFVREAIQENKFAFASDVIRLYAIFQYGGIYMDTDVEVLKTFNPFLHHQMFSGFETNNNVPTGMMAAEKGSVWAKELLEQYNDRHFVLEDGSFDLTTNTTVITEYMKNKGLLLNNKFQDFPGLCTMYPSEYFCPKDHTTGKIKCTKNTVCIHHFAGSWLPHSFLSDLRHNLKYLLGAQDFLLAPFT